MPCEMSEVPEVTKNNLKFRRKKMKKTIEKEISYLSATNLWFFSRFWHSRFFPFPLVFAKMQPHLTSSLVLFLVLFSFLFHFPPFSKNVELRLHVIKTTPNISHLALRSSSSLLTLVSIMLAQNPSNLCKPRTQKPFKSQTFRIGSVQSRSSQWDTRWKGFEPISEWIPDIVIRETSYWMITWEE